MDKDTNIEVPNDSINRGLEALAAHPRVPERIGNVALRIAETRTSIRRPLYGARVRMEQRAERATDASEQSRQRLGEQIDKFQSIGK